MEYVATFVSHYAAMRFARALEGQGVPCRLRPVPRSLSSSCGTCAVFEGENWDVGPRYGLEGIWKKEGERWIGLWRVTQ